MFSTVRKEIVDMVQQLYWLKALKKDETKEKLNIYGVSVKDLNIYVTTDKDVIRGINRIPGPFFLLNNQQEDKRSHSSGSEMDFDDDYVLIDKKEFQQRIEVPQEKLDKEELIKNASVSKLIHADNNQVVTLENFKIKKVIDKGSFGKVFLVINTLDGKEYAMKRINKDILIEKGQILNTRTEKDILT